METDILRGELERLFKLDELLSLARDILGHEPDDVGGTGAPSTFARALVERCQADEGLDALADAIVAQKSDVDPRVREATVHGFPALGELAPGAKLGPYTITKKVADGHLAQVYQAKNADNKDVSLRVLRVDLGADRRRVNRYLALARLTFRVDHKAIPKNGFARWQDGRAVIGHDWIDAPPLAARITRTGPMHLNEARPILAAILEGLAALHEKKLAHGNLKLENVLVGRPDASGVPAWLLDFGVDRLRRRARQAPDALGMVLSPKIAAPELVRGKPADARSDVYAFGVLAYEVLSGKPPFAAGTPVELASLHLSKPADAPSAVAPRGWVTKELDAFVLSLLDKDPTARPKDAAAVLEQLANLGKKPADKPAAKITEDELTARIDKLVEKPDDEEAALSLESAIADGGDATKIADAFAMAADVVEEGEGDAAAANKETKKSLLYRAARLFEQSVKDDARAEALYAEIQKLDPNDDVARVALEGVRRKLGKLDEVIEAMLERAEKAETPEARARAMAEIGQIYASDMDDKAQALVAYTQALAEDPRTEAYAHELERLAGTDAALWTEALSTLTQASTGDLPAESRAALLMHLGGWYAKKVGRADLALPCFQAVVTVDPGNDAALEGMADIYRTAQQWPELGTVLLRRAEVALNPAKARDLRASAAEILDQRLSEPLRAKDLYEQILESDPTHDSAADALGRIYERTGDNAGLVKILERKAEAQRGEAKAKVLCRIAELFEGQLDDLNEAVRRYEAAIGADERNLEALKGLDRIFNRTGRYKELLSNLDRQLAIAATPRQKITLLERIASIHDEEFLDHVAASAAYEQILGIDGAHENALTALVRHYRALDRWEDVVGIYDKHLKVTGDVSRRVELLLAKGRVLVEQVGSPERAMQAYESVLEASPDHSGALEALARLREKTGDATAALGAIEALASKATTKEAKAEQWLRAAKLLESRGDRDGAIERYKAALDADPQNVAATAALRSAYSARGDAASAVELIAREIETETGKLQKARLYGEMAKLLRDRLKDDARAAEAAKKAIDLDPTAIDALMVTGDLAFEGGRFLEASRAYESLAARTDALPKEDATRILVRFVDSLAKSGSTEKAMTAVEVLMRLAPDDGEAIGRVALVVFEHGEPARAYEVQKTYVDRFGQKLLGTERSAALYRLGESARRVQKRKEAIDALSEAADLDPSAAAPLESLAKVHADAGEWEEVVRVKNRRLDVAGADERGELLVDIGDLIATKIGDRTRAAKTFVTALEDRPGDRRLLTKLMQLYSEEKDWAKLVEIVLRLADFVDDKKQKAKYVHTAANITHKQLGDLDQAIGYYDQVLALDPSLPKALAEAIELRREKADWPGVEKLLQTQLETAQEADDNATLLATFDALGELYHKHLGKVADAIDAYEAAQTLDPDDKARNEKLADMYASDPAQYLDKAVAAQRGLLRRNPHKAESYKLLRKLYTESKHADSAWCLCQALYVLNLAEPDEERFFKRMRADGPAAAQDRLNEEDWVRRLGHEDADPLVTAIFALIEPAVLAARAKPLEELGYDERYALDLSLHPYPMSQTLFYAAGVLGTDAPMTFQNQHDQGGLSFLHAQTPSLVLGRAALVADIPPQAAAFLAARQLTAYRPGFYLRHLIPTGTGLRAWLYAAIKLVVDKFPVTADLETSVKENIEQLQRNFTATQKDHLTSVVSKLVSSGGSLDLKKWVAAVDLTADRAGFLVAHDLEVATELIKASDDGSTAMPVRDRLKELVLFSVSDEYFALRQKLGIAIDS